jgi:sterol desaturase/sphingolipid hydroxylase (fatty acid hydroxylase superfamily)
MADPAIEQKKVGEAFPRDRRGFWQPERGTAPPSPIFAWPPRPLAVIKWLYGYLFPWNLLYMSIATVTWLYWQPALARCVDFRWDWMMEMFVRNEIMLITVTSAWHIRLWSQKNQGTKYKFTKDWMAVGNRKFLRGSQLGENVMWTLISGVTWTGYEIVMMWAYANDMLPYIDPRQEPIYFGILLCGIVMWRQLHFYWSHRITHWPPLYKAAHYLHHRNINIGPWSGLSMHPIEHIIYFSCILLHWIVPSHPIHMLMNAQHAAFAPSQGHVGFEKMKLPGDIHVAAGNYFHQLHHRYFECNYGGPEVPFDAWFGTYHDGSSESHSTMRDRRKAAHNVTTETD